jgi:GNAT superfamily N-acetyltransferase
MAYTITPVRSRRELRTFIYLPEKIHRHHTNWVPPVYMDEWVFFDPKKNPAFAHSDTLLLLAWEGKRPVGRIMGIINHKYNQKHGENDARFFALECYEEYGIAAVLLGAVEAWAREKGAANLVGPLGFSDKDPQGLLIEGFDEPVVIASACNFPFLADYVERAGYTRKTDLVVYHLQVPEVIPEFYRAISERARRNNNGLKLVELKSKRQIKRWVRPVFHLVNETFGDIYAFSEMSEREMDEFAARYMAILDPRFLKLIVNPDGELVAFVLAMPDISRGIVKAKGRVLPFGFVHILRSQKTTTQLNLLLGAVKEGYRNNGIDTLLGVSTLESAKAAGMKTIDSHLELETNIKVRAEMEKMGGRVYKRFRIYTSNLYPARQE